MSEQANEIQHALSKEGLLRKGTRPYASFTIPENVVGSILERSIFGDRNVLPVEIESSETVIYIPIEGKVPKELDYFLLHPNIDHKIDFDTPHGTIEANVRDHTYSKTIEKGGHQEIEDEGKQIEKLMQSLGFEYKDRF